MLSRTLTVVAGSAVAFGLGAVPAMACTVTADPVVKADVAVAAPVTVHVPHVHHHHHVLPAVVADVL
jgi:hypothetical protein